jgi:hypothetical protein
LDPVLEAVAELPEGGLPIPSSAEIRVRQFFQRQVRPVIAFAGVLPQLPQENKAVNVQPKDAQSIQQVQDFLQQLTDLSWSLSGLEHAGPAASAALQLVADAARFVARQHVIEKGSLAYIVLLTQTYRAGGSMASPSPHRHVLFLSVGLSYGGGKLLRQQSGMVCQ